MYFYPGLKAERFVYEMKSTPFLMRTEKSSYNNSSLSAENKVEVERDGRGFKELRANSNRNCNGESELN